MTPDLLTVTTVVKKGGGKGGAGGGQTSTHVAVEAPNSLRSRSTARILEVLSEGIVKGLATGDARSVYLDKTPILNADMTGNFNVPQFYFRDGSPDQDVVPGFPAAEAEVGVGVVMDYAVPIIRRISPGLSSIRYKVRVQSLFQQTKEGDVNPSRVEYTMDVRVGTGAWAGYIYEGIDGKTMSPYERAVRIVLPVTDQPIDIRLTRTTPPAADSSTANTIYFSGFTEIIDGAMKYDDTCVAAMTVDAQYFPNVPSRGYLLDGIICRVPSNFYLTSPDYPNYLPWSGHFENAAWTTAGPLTRAGAANAGSVSGWATLITSITSAGNKRISSPARALAGLPGAWSASWWFRKGVDTGAHTLRLEIYDDTNRGRWVSVNPTSGLFQSGDVLPASPDWTADHGALTTLEDGSYRLDLACHYNGGGVAPVSIRVRCNIMSAAIGDTMTCYGAVLTPGNKFGAFIDTQATVPISGPQYLGDRYYDGDWDGTFKDDWTDNPAWILYELLTNERFGIGRDIDVQAADKWSFYEAAQYNDGMVPDGEGGSGVQPRFTCNCVINTRQEAFTVLNAVASSMHAALFYANGTVFLVQDREQGTPERIFSPANVVDGLFDYMGTDYRSLFNAINITWNDPAQDYEPVVELVQDPDLVARQGYREKPEEAFACTVRGQAIRHGRWLIYTAQYETEMVTFRTGLENIDLRPGQLIAINDPSRAGARLGGRLLDDAGADTITLDKRAPDIAVGWTIYATEGTAAEGAAPLMLTMIVVELLAGNQLRVTGKTVALPAQTMWLASSSEVEPTPWRVLAVKDNGQSVYEVLSATYSAGKYPYVDLGMSIPPPSTSLIPSGPLLGPSGPAMREYIYQDASGVVQFGIVLSWDASPDPRVAYYVVEMKGPAADYRRFPNIVGVSIDVPRMRQGTWDVTLSAVDNIGRRSLGFAFSFNTVGLTAKPGPPNALYLQPEGSLLHLTWVQTAEVDVAYWWVKWSRYTDSSAIWNRATTIGARVGRQTVQMNVPLRAGTYFVKAVDSLGQESTEAAIAILQPQQTQLNALVDIAEQPAWGGVRGVWEIDGAQLWLPPPLEPEVVPPEIYPGDRGLALNQTPTRVEVYGFLSSFDAGVATELHMSGLVDAYGTIGDDVMANWVPLAVAVPLARGASSNWDAHTEARISQDGVTFADWFPIKYAIITARKAEFRMIGSIYDLDTTLKAVGAEIIIEVANRSLRGEDVPVDGSGHYSVVYAPPFAARPVVQITGRQNIAAGGNIVITASTRDGFTVENRNAAGAAITGASFDYFVQGYGVH